MSTGANRGLVLAAMIFAVAMTFIDQTIVAIAAPDLQADLSLSATGVQWIINGYLLSLSALFAFGGRLADIAGHRRMVVIGVIVFASSSALCGATPTGGIGEAWIITFRVIQGAGAALMFPAALAIVIAAYPLEERGKAMAIFFGIAGGLTSVGPIAGGYLTEWTWRAIFWVNIPVAIIALVLIAISKPEDERHPAPIDYRGTLLIAAGMGIAVLGLQQASVWGWGSVATIGCLVAGLAILALFIRFELSIPEPLLRMRIFEDRRFAMQNVVLFLLMICFVPLFFFASTYAQISLGDSASNAGLYLLTFFAGLRDRGPGRRADPRRARRQACGRRRLGDRRGRLLPLGPRAPRPQLRRPVDLHRPRRRGGRPGARALEHGRDQPRPPQQLRRGDRDHPDGPQLRLEPWPCGAGDDPHPREQVQPRIRAGRPRGAEGEERTRSPSRSARPAAAATSRRAAGGARRSSCTRSSTATRSPRGRSSTRWPG